jgi:hypothetical protein
MNAVHLHAGQIVSTPLWEGGQPVRIRDAVRDGNRMSVDFQDVRCHHRAQRVEVPFGFEVDLVGGAR